MQGIQGTGSYAGGEIAREYRNREGLSFSFRAPFGKRTILMANL